jgi:hypothetical protein
VVLSGGHRALSLRPIAGGFPPVVDEGGYLPWRATVSVTVYRAGGNGTAAELPLPGLLPEPWLLDRGASEEGEPELDEPGADAAQTRWKRSARLVYAAATKPTRRPLEALREAGTVESYYL